MGRMKKADAEQASREGGAETAASSDGGGASGGGAAARQCCLCKRCVAEGEDHILGACTHCKQQAFHMECATEHIERLLKLEAKLGGHTNKGLKAVLLVTKDRPQDLLASNGRPQKWKLLRPCPACQEGTLVAADVVKAQKCRPSLPVMAPAPRPPRVPAPKQAAAGKQAPAVKTAEQPYSKPIQQHYEAPGRVADRMRSGSSTGSFAAEQERLAKEARVEEQLLKRAAAQRRASAAAAEQQQADADSQTTAALATGGDAGGDASTGSFDAEVVWRPGPEDGGAPHLGASTPHAQQLLSRHVSGNASLAHNSSVDYAGGAPAGAFWAQEINTGGGGGGGFDYTPARGASEGHHIYDGDNAGGLPAWLHSPAAEAGVTALSTPKPAEEHWPVAEQWPAAAPAVEWLAPQFEGREEAPEEVIDELMAMLMGLGAE